MNDLKFAIRQLLKNPGFTAMAVLTLALGIGVNTSIFGAVQVLINRALPYPKPDRLAQVLQSSPTSPWMTHHSAPNFVDYRESGVFERVAALNDRPFTLSEPGQPAEIVRGLQVSWDFFPLLCVQPTQGRWFTQEEDQPGRNDVAILDHGFWQRRFAGAPDIVGRVIRLDGEPVTVIGVMPPAFRDRLLTGPVDLWRPIAFTPAQLAHRGHQYLKCIARLKSGESWPQVRANAEVLATRQKEAHPENSAPSLRLVPLGEASLPPVARRMAWSVMALAGLVLLIACANLANLQFAQMVRRSREFAIRQALGAPRRRVFQQILIECLILGGIGGVLGLIFAHWSNDLLSRLFMSDGEKILQLTLDPRTLGFAALATIGSGLAFGLLPAGLAVRGQVETALKQSSRGTTGDRSAHRLQHGLIIAETALTFVLLAGAGLVVGGLQNFARIDPGWKVEGITAGFLTLPEVKYGNKTALRAFSQRLEQDLVNSPGVTGAALCWNLPIFQFNVSSSFQIEGQPKPPQGSSRSCSVNGVTPGYFSTLGMRLLSGRLFTVADNSDRPAVVIINESMARMLWPGASPLGHRLNGAEIVGVVGDVDFPTNPTKRRTPYQTYRPLAQEPRGTLTAVVRGNVTGNVLRQLVAGVDPDQPVGQPGPIVNAIGQSLDNWAMGGRLLGGFALIGLVLAALGIYGVVSGFVARRTAEIGVRMALGAQLRDVLWLVLGKGLRLALVGTVLGVAGAIALARVSRTLLPELPSSPLAVMPIVVLVVTASTMLACWVPARRALKVDPMEALRNE